MKLFEIFKNWKSLNELWTLLQPFILKLVEKKVPSAITKLYENLAKYTQPAIDSLFKLKEKIKNSPNALDDYCFYQGVLALETFANHLQETITKLRG